MFFGQPRFTAVLMLAPLAFLVTGCEFDLLQPKASAPTSSSATATAGVDQSKMKIQPLLSAAVPEGSISVGVGADVLGSNAPSASMQSKVSQDVIAKAPQVGSGYQLDSSQDALVAFVSSLAEAEQEAFVANNIFLFGAGNVPQLPAQQAPAGVGANARPAVPGACLNLPPANATSACHFLTMGGICSSRMLAFLQRGCLVGVWVQVLSHGVWVNVPVTPINGLPNVNVNGNSPPFSAWRWGALGNLCGC